MTSTAKVDQAARVKARERRLAMERDRAARDSRIEDAAAAVFAALASRTDAERASTAAEERVAGGLRRLLDEGLTAQQAAHLCDLTVGAAQKLLRRHTAPAPLHHSDARTSPSATSGIAVSAATGRMRACPEGRAVAMSDNATAQVQLRAILQLIDRAVSALVEDESSIGLACESQARAALAALERVVSDRSAPPGVQTSRPPDARMVDDLDDAALLLAAAERQLAALPVEARNQLPLCAAATYLRRARRALATP